LDIMAEFGRIWHVVVREREITDVIVIPLDGDPERWAPGRRPGTAGGGGPAPAAARQGTPARGLRPGISGRVRASRCSVGSRNGVRGRKWARKWAGTGGGEWL
jgi:hypothetical protein